MWFGEIYALNYLASVQMVSLFIMIYVYSRNKEKEVRIPNYSNFTCIAYQRTRNNTLNYFLNNTPCFQSNFLQLN